MKSLVSRALMPYGSCYAIEPQAASAILRALEGVDMAAHLRAYRGTAQDAQETPKKPYQMAGSVARLSLAGPLTKELSSMADYFGGTSTAQFADAITQAAADPNVRAILMDLDSPGGSVAGTDACAEAVRQATMKKPVYGHAADLCCSACYWIGSQASALYAGPGAVVGSIGVVSVIYDTSEAAKAEGVTAHVVSSGPFKGAGASGAPVSPEHLAEFQRVIDDSASQFVAAVAKGRKMPVADARVLADGRVHVAGSEPAGLIDGVMRADVLLKKIQSDPKALIPSRTTHPNARMGNDNARTHAGLDTAPTGQEKTPMKHLLAAALGRLGKHTLAGKVSAAPDDSEGNTDPKALADLLASEASAEVDAQVKATLDANPLLSALATDGITTPEQYTALSADAARGKKVTDELRKTAKSDAIVAFGAEQGATYAATIDALPAGPALTGYAAHLAAEAEKKVPAAGGTAQTKKTQNDGVSYAQDASQGDDLAAIEKRKAELLGMTSVGRSALAAKG